MPSRVTLDDLIFQLCAFDGEHPDYMLWLGAGASVSSGVPAASGVVVKLLRQMYAQRQRRSVGDVEEVPEGDIRVWARQTLDWFDPTNRAKSEYAQVMENAYRAPGMREAFLRDIIRQAQVSQGYRNLGLLLRHKLFDTVLTTNFDHLVRRGADLVLPQPITEVNALAQYPQQTSFPRDPRLIRLHGDFWHGNVLNTEGELKRTPSIRFEAVKQLLRTYGLIVIGYGGWDRSVMRGLLEPLRDDPNVLGKGLYWCHPQGAPLSHLVEAFLDTGPEDRFFLVEIESFDDVMQQFVATFRLELPLVVRFQEQLAVAWEGQSLLVDLVEELLAESTVALVRQQELLRRLAQLLGDPQAILVCRDPHSQEWRVAAAVNVTRPHEQVILDPRSLSRFTESGTEYVAFAAAERPTEDPFHQIFEAGRVIENFPVWRGGRLVGFIAFASNQPLIEAPHILRLLKTAVRLLVSLP